MVFKTLRLKPLMIGIKKKETKKQAGILIHGGSHYS